MARQFDYCVETGHFVDTLGASPVEYRIGASLVLVILAIYSRIVFMTILSGLVIPTTLGQSNIRHFLTTSCLVTCDSFFF